MSVSTLALCIPAFNAGWCLPRLLASATAPGMPFSEILVFDDASTDDTSAVARAFGARVVRADENRGCAHGKNVLVQAATSSWLHFHDADDALLAAFAPVARRWMAEPAPPDVVLLSYECRDHGTDELLAVRTFDDTRVREDAVAFAIAEQINNFGLYRRSAFVCAGGYDADPAVLYNEDVAMHLRLALAGLTFRAEAEPTGISYRVRGSMSAMNQARCTVAQYHVLRKAAMQSAPRHRGVLGSRLWQIAGNAMMHDDRDIARAAVALARELRGRVPPTGAGSLAFRIAAIFAPGLALAAREQLVRRTRPHLRRAVGAGSSVAATAAPAPVDRR